MLYRITAPNEKYTGDVAGVHFVAGQAVTDDPAALAYCRSAGYTIEPTDDQADEAPAAEAPNLTPSRPTTSGTKAEWVAWAVACGADPQEADRLTKQQLVDTYGDREPAPVTGD